MEALSGRARPTQRKATFGAIADCNEAIHLDPKNGKAYSYCAYVHTTHDEFDEAIKDYRRAIELKPRDAYAWLCVSGPN